jgi:hypothetical protein
MYNTRILPGNNSLIVSGSAPLREIPNPPLFHLFIHPFPVWMPARKHIHAPNIPFANSSPRLRRRKNTLLPPRLPLLLPRTLTIREQEATRPLIRAGRLAHPPHISSKQQRPSTKTEQHTVTYKPRRESETPPAHQLRVKVESRDSLESHGDSRGSLAELVGGGNACFARGGGGFFAAANSSFVFGTAAGTACW